MKKFIIMILTVALVLSFAACANTDDKEPAVTKEPASEPTAEPAQSTPDPVKGEGVMTYAEYMAAPEEAEVCIEAYVQDHQDWWEGKITVYLQDGDGAYFAYELACSEEDATKLVPGTKIKIAGHKKIWSGEVEIMDGIFSFQEGSWIAPATDVTALLGTEELVNKQNMFVSFKGMTVEASKDADGNDVPFLYKWNGSGSQGDDLYFNVSVNGATYTFTVESYLRGADTDVYKAVEALEIGDKINLEGFLYWYEGVNPHITSVAKVVE